MEKAAEFAIVCDTQPDGQQTSILVNKLKYERSGTTKNYTCNDSNMTLNFMDKDVFDSVRDEPRFKAVYDRLKSYAKVSAEG